MTAPGLLRPIHLTLNWDVLTLQDTRQLHAHIAYHRDIRLRLGRTRLERWKDVLLSYQAKYNTWRLIYSDTPRMKGEPTEQQYCQYIRSFEEIEMRALQEIYDSSLFWHCKVYDVERAAWELIDRDILHFREGWVELFSLFVPELDTDDATKNSSIQIFSTQYSSTFIRWCMIHAALKDASRKKQERNPKLMSLLNKITIHANELHDLGTRPGSMGMIQRRNFSSAEMLDHLPKTNAIRSPSSSPESSATRVRGNQVPVKVVAPWRVYVGTKEIDYECMKAVDTAIWLNNDSFEWYKNAAGKKGKPEYKLHFKATFDPLNVEKMYPIPIADVGVSGPMPERWLWARDLGQVVKLLPKIPPTWDRTRQVLPPLTKANLRRFLGKGRG